MVRELLKEAVGGDTGYQKDVAFKPQVGGLSRLKVGELREKLSEQGLSTTGTKPVLLARLKEALQVSSSPGSAGAPAKTEDTLGPASEGRAELVKKIRQTRDAPVVEKSMTGDHSKKQETQACVLAEPSCPSQVLIEEGTSEALDTRGDFKVNVVIKIQSRGKEEEEVNGGETDPPAEKPDEIGAENRPRKGNIIPMEKVLDKLFASKSIPRQKPKSGKFWKGERTQFRQIKRGGGKRDRDQKPSFEQRLKIKEEKLEKSIDENKTRKLVRTRPNSRDCLRSLIIPTK